MQAKNLIFKRYRSVIQITDPRPVYNGEFDTEYQKLDGSTLPSTGKNPRKPGHVLTSEKNHMLAASAVRMMSHDPALASQVLAQPAELNILN